jgi:hypothetical protein
MVQQLKLIVVTETGLGHEVTTTVPILSLDDLNHLSIPNLPEGEVKETKLTSSDWTLGIAMCYPIRIGKGDTLEINVDIDQLSADLLLTELPEMALKLTNEHLNFWVENKYNVLFEGKHGTGKTEIIKALFTERYGEQGVGWVYFSAATMDPWVDFVGVPKEVHDKDGPYLELIKPKVFRDGKIKAIFFDELNRAHPKVRNAVMELIQFKSVNGKKFDSLEVIWAAINPNDEVDDDEEKVYNVEPLDPAQLDRFHVQVTMPYDVNKEYFIDKWGKNTGTAACDWWRGQTESTQKLISPRRLDTAVEIELAGGEVRGFVLPECSNVSKFKQDIKHGSPFMQLEVLVKENDDAKISKFTDNLDNWTAVAAKVIKNKKLLERILPCCPIETVAALVSANKTVSRHVFDYPHKFERLINSLASSADNAELRNKASIALVELAAIKDASEHINTKHLDTQFREKSYKSKAIKCRKRLLIREDFAETKLKTGPHTVSDRVKLKKIIESADTIKTSKKIDVIDNLLINITTQMSGDSAECTLKTLDYLCNTLQPSTLALVEKIDLVISTTVYALLKNKTVSNEFLVNNLIDSYPNLMARYIYDVVRPNSNISQTKRDNLIFYMKPIPIDII